MRRLLIFLIAGSLLLWAANRKRLLLTEWLFPAWVSITPDIAYGPDTRQVLDVERPRWPIASAAPAAVIIHGGGWTGGNRRSMWVPFCSVYLRHGFVVVNLEYRVGAILPAVDDAQRALAWVFDHAAAYRIDPRRIVVEGGSAGAHLAMMAAFQSQPRPAAVIDFYGVTDMTDVMRLPSYRGVLPRDNTEEAARLVSPVRYLQPPIPAVLALHGSDDGIVPVQESHKLVAAVRPAGGVAEEVVLDGAIHGFTPAEQDLANEAVLRFLRGRGILR